MMYGLEMLNNYVTAALEGHTQGEPVIEFTYCGRNRVIVTAYMKHWRTSSRTPYGAYEGQHTCEWWASGEVDLDPEAIVQHIKLASQDYQ